MRTCTRLLATGVAAVAMTATGVVIAGETNLPSIDGVTLTTRAEAPSDHPLSEIISGFEFRTKETQALELDDFINPGFLAVDVGEEAWSAVEGSAGKSCESCHGDAEASMAGVRAGMPKWNASADRPFTMENQINACRSEQMGADEWGWESDQMLGMTAYLGLQSRGMPVAIDLQAGDMRTWWEKGENLYYTRIGQLDLACANCHENNYGNYIRADRLSQGHSNGFPTYRLKWQKMGSLHRRFKGCMDNIRAKAYKRGSDEFVALETYLAWRGQGLSVETPAVRN